MGIRGRFPWLPVFILVSTEVADWIFDKVAILHSNGVGIEFYISLVAKPWIWFGLLTAPLQLWLWTRILRKTDLSTAYPATTLSYPLTMLSAVFLFGEHLSPLVWIGALLVMAGVAAIGIREPEATFNAGRERSVNVRV